MLNERTVRLSLCLVSQCLTKMCALENDSTNIVLSYHLGIMCNISLYYNSWYTCYDMIYMFVLHLNNVRLINQIVCNFARTTISETFLDPLTFNDFYTRSFACSQTFSDSDARFAIFYKDMCDEIVNIVFKRTWHETEHEFGTARVILEESDYLPKRWIRRCILVE